MITVTHTSSRSSANFNDNYFDIEGVPMTNANTITIHEALNDKHSVYGDEAFSPKPNGSSYSISVRGMIGKKEFTDVPELKSYILSKLNLCLPKLKKRSQ